MAAASVMPVVHQSVTSPAPAQYHTSTPQTSFVKATPTSSPAMHPASSTVPVTYTTPSGTTHQVPSHLLHNASPTTVYSATPTTTYTTKPTTTVPGTTNVISRSVGTPYTPSGAMQSGVPTSTTSVPFTTTTVPYTTTLPHGATSVPYTTSSAMPYTTTTSAMPVTTVHASSVPTTVTRAIAQPTISAAHTSGLYVPSGTQRVNHQQPLKGGMYAMYDSNMVPTFEAPLVVGPVPDHMLPQLEVVERVASSVVPMMQPRGISGLSRPTTRSVKPIKQRNACGC